MRNRPASTAPVGVWLKARTPLSERYPCMCYGSRACTRRCPCHGRHDGEGMPVTCCGRVESLPRNDAGPGSDVRSGSVRGARRERVNAQTAGLDPDDKDRSPA